MGISKLSQFGLLGLWQLITCSDLRSGWGLKQTCSSPWEFFNGVLHFTCTHRGRVDSRLLVVGSQIVNLTPGLSFAHNLCCKCLNGSCEAIFDIYASRPFQHYKEHLKARCFDPCNWILNFQESRRTPKSPFRECECHPHTPLKWNCDIVLGQFYHLFSLWLNNGISYFPVKRYHSHYVFMFSTQEVLPNVFFIFTQCVHF